MLIESKPIHWKRENHVWMKRGFSCNFYIRSKTKMTLWLPRGSFLKLSDNNQNWRSMAGLLKKSWMKSFKCPFPVWWRSLNGLKSTYAATFSAVGSENCMPGGTEKRNYILPAVTRLVRKLTKTEMIAFVLKAIRVVWKSFSFHHFHLFIFLESKGKWSVITSLI